MTMLKNAGPYWVLYEGTPGGRLDQKDGFFVLSNGLRASLGEQWAGNFPGPRWAYFGGANLSSILFLANHQPDAQPDQYWPMNNEMTVFGFGRGFTCCRQYFNTSPARFTIGLLPATDTDTARKRIESLTREMTVRQSRVETRP